MALNVTFFALNWLSRDVLLLWGCKVNELIAVGQVWRLLTPIFLHSNLLHLAVNTHALHTLGPQVEMVSGARRTTAIYLLSGVVATAASFLLCASPSLGASGAVFGLGAAMGVFYWRHRDMLGTYSEAGLRSLGLTAAINIGYSMLNKRIDNWGHLGGVVGGALLAFLLGPHFVTRTSPETGRKLVSDEPPLPWLAFDKAGALSAGGRPPAPRRRAKTAGLLQPGQQQQAGPELLGEKPAGGSSSGK